MAHRWRWWDGAKPRGPGKLTSSPAKSLCDSLLTSRASRSHSVSVRPFEGLGVEVGGLIGATDEGQQRPAVTGASGMAIGYLHRSHANSAACTDLTADSRGCSDQLPGRPAHLGARRGSE